MFNIEIKNKANRDEVIRWLRKNVSHERLDISGSLAYDEVGCIVFEVPRFQPYAFFAREKDAVLFSLRWA